ncbi:hypothetical protein APX70_00983, partial [Pseudomonas syringae pv. maculicola]
QSCCVMMTALAFFTNPVTDCPSYVTLTPYQSSAPSLMTAALLTN